MHSILGTFGVGLVLLGSNLVAGFQVDGWDTYRDMKFAGPPGRTVVGGGGKMGRCEN